jgi:hypothetical protein
MASSSASADGPGTRSLDTARDAPGSEDVYTGEDGN